MERRIVRSMLMIVIAAWLFNASGQTPTKEYIYLGGRVVALENPADTAAPSVVGSVSVAPTETSAAITWSTNEAAVYQIDYGPSASYGTTVPAQFGTTYGTIHGQTLSGLTANTTYHYRIRLRDATGNESATVDAIFSTDTTPPSILGTVAVNSLAFSATLSWSTTEPAVYQIEYGQTSSYGTTVPVQFGTAYSNSHSHTLSGLTANTTYHYRIRLKDAAGNVFVTANATFTTTTADTTTPSILGTVAVNPMAFSATLSWSTTEPAVYQIEYGQTTSYGTTVPMQFGTAYSNSHSHTLSGLTANTTYHYRIRLKDAAGNQSPGADATFTTSCSISVNPTSILTYASLTTGIEAICGGSNIAWMLTGSGSLATFPGTPNAAYTAPSGISSAQAAVARATASGGAFAESAITVLPNDPPTILGGYPVSGVGTRQLFTTHVGDLQGASNIAAVQVVLKSDWAKTCHYYLNSQWNLLGLYLDDGSSVYQPIGSAQALQNSQSPAPRFPWTLICDKENQDVQHETSGFRARARSPEGD